MYLISSSFRHFSSFVVHACISKSMVKVCMRGHLNNKKDINNICKEMMKEMTVEKEKRREERG